MKKYVLICALGLITNPAMAENVKPIELIRGFGKTPVPYPFMAQQFDENITTMLAATILAGKTSRLDEGALRNLLGSSLTNELLLYCTKELKKQFELSIEEKVAAFKKDCSEARKKDPPTHILFKGAYSYYEGKKDAANWAAITASPRGLTEIGIGIEIGAEVQAGISVGAAASIPIKALISGHVNTNLMDTENVDPTSGKGPSINVSCTTSTLTAIKYSVNASCVVIMNLNSTKGLKVDGPSVEGLLKID